MNMRLGNSSRKQSSASGDTTDVVEVTEMQWGSSHEWSAVMEMEKLLGWAGSPREGAALKKDGALLWDRWQSG